MQVHGGVAYTRGHDLHRWLDRAIALGTEVGVTADVEQRVGERAMGVDWR
jgi:alkylation response protein AidB-like acyl-CoA dehydrogenase